MIMIKMYSSVAQLPIFRKYERWPTLSCKMRWVVVFLVSCFSRSAEAWFSSVPVAGLLRHEARRGTRAVGFPSARRLCSRHASAQLLQQQQQQRNGARRGAGKAMAGVMSSAEMDVVDGDIVVVVGASGGVGRLVTQSLAATGKYKVKGLVRNLEKAKEALADGEGLDLELVQGNILDEESLNAAMKNAACVVACTGTTAFPSARWGGGNTPDAVDNVAVGNMLRAAAAPSNHPDGKLKRFVLLSSVGVERADKFPFVVLNAFGVLDAKAKGEEAVRRAAEDGGFSFSIVRPGQIKGEPFASYSANGVRSTAAGTEGPSGKAPKRMVSLRQGDKEAGDVNPSSVAAVFTQAVGQPGAAGKSFTVVNVLGSDPTQGEWDKLFSEL